MTSHRACDEAIIQVFRHAETEVILGGFADEIAWQRSRSVESVTESDFLAEAAWVILSAGMAYTVVSRIFQQFSAAFLNWESAAAIAAHREECVSGALAAFGNRRKVEAVAAVASLTYHRGFDCVRRSIQVEGAEFLGTLPGVGPITRHHLAKNLGMRVAKADRHLQRIAAYLGFDSAGSLCERTSELTGECPAVIDLIFWRYAVLNPEYARVFTDHRTHELSRAGRRLSRKPRRGNRVVLAA